MKNKLMSTLAALVIASTAVSCKSTNTITTVTQVEGVVIKTVDVGMQTWRDYVVAGKASQAQVNTVMNAYNTYYNAQMIAKGAIEQYLATGSTNQADVAVANQAVSQAETSLLSLLNQYLINK